jgi:hypothetical protein
LRLAAGASCALDETEYRRTTVLLPIARTNHKKMMIAGGTSSAKWRGLIGSFSLKRAHDARPQAPATRVAHSSLTIVAKKRDRYTIGAAFEVNTR